MRVFLPHLVDLHVLPVEYVLQLVVMDEVQNPVRGDVPSAWRLHLTCLRTRLRDLLDDLLGWEKSGALASELSMTTRWEDDPSQQVVKVFDLDEVLGDVYEL